ncbi:MAG: hypothetical protein OXB88_08635 [Bacteriovoracales bacterium]|nr:hypothetical protein [Bacteriovoracales bacterium]
MSMETLYGALILRKKDKALEILPQRVLESDKSSPLGGDILPLFPSEKEFKKHVEKSYGRIFLPPIPLGARHHEGAKLAISLLLLQIEGPPQAHPSHQNWIDIHHLKEVSEPLGAILCETLAMFWPILPTSHGPCTSFYTLHPELHKAQELVFFPGTFDPLHAGHLSCLSLCQARPLIIAPDHNPQKKPRENALFWSLYQKLRLKAQDMESKSQKGLYVYPGFCGMEKPNPTVQWLGKGGGKKGLLLGDDCFMSLATWQNVETLITSLDTLYVAPRYINGDIRIERRTFQDQADKLLSLNPALAIERLSHHPHEHLSSSQIRRSS